MKSSIVMFHVFSVTVREYKLVSGALLMYCGWWCAQHFTHTALNLQHSPWGRWCLLHFRVKFLLRVCPHPAVPQCQAVRPSGVWGRRPSSLQAFALSPVQRWQPGGLTLLRKAGAPPSWERQVPSSEVCCPSLSHPLSPLTDAFSLCDSSLLFQMRPHPLLGAGLSADLDCPQLLWVLAKSNAQCLCGLFAAGKQVRGAEQQAYQQGELLRFPSWSLGLNWGSLAFVEACSNSVSVTFPQPRPEAILQWLCSYLFLVISVIRSWCSWASHEMRSLWPENRPGSLQMPCVKCCRSPRRDRGPQSTPLWMPWKCWGKGWQKRQFKSACWTQESINMFMKKGRQALLCPDCLRMSIFHFRTHS